MKISFEYKENNLAKGVKFTVRTKGIELFKESKSCILHHKQTETGKYNVYTVTRNTLIKLLESYGEYKPRYNWND